MGILNGRLDSGETPNTVAAPVNRYVTPPTSGNSGLGEFLSAIGKLQPEATQALNNADQQVGDDAEAQANKAALTADPAALRQEIASGNYFGLAHRRAQSALRVMDATNRAFDVSSTFDGMKQRGELAGADPTKKLSEAGDGFTSKAETPCSPTQVTALHVQDSTGATTWYVRDGQDADALRSAMRWADDAEKGSDIPDPVYH